jgi:hypothetical protein
VLQYICDAIIVLVLITSQRELIQIFPAYTIGKGGNGTDHLTFMLESCMYFPEPELFFLHETEIGLFFSSNFTKMSF